MATVDIYRTNDGRGYFTFSFIDEGPYWRVDIEKVPPSASHHMADLHGTHCLPSSRAATGYKICFGNPFDAYSMSKAQKFSEAWAEGVWEWVKSGRRIKQF